MARKMKDSGIEWIGEIPEGWSKNKVIRLFDIIGSGTTPKNITSDFPVVNWIQSGDITGSFVPACKNVISANLLSQYSALKVYPAPFIIIAMYGASVGNASISLIDGCVNQACCVLSSPSCNLHYAFYVIKSAQSYLVRKAVGGGQPNISQETIKQLWLPLPPLSTQDIIVRNLDATCSKIDDLLTSVHASIEEYKKLKQAVITQAVTKGVRGEREMKDSGVEWIGEIPAEWSICPLKRLAAIQTGSTPSKTSSESFYSSITGTPWIKPDNLGFSSSIETTAEFLTEEGCSVARTFPSNTVYVGCIGSRIGNCGYSLIPCACNQQINALIFNARMYWKYGWYLTIFQEEQYMLLANGNVIQIINSTTQGNISCIVPSISEQREITAYLDAKCAEIDRLIAKKEQLVKELESYKKSLIYEVVTGKREV